ncbi:E/l/f/v dehydrogenase family protein [Pandoravirus kuranda]|uniref:E/l/f/v dehydrogenase family protein n=2 Tax=Pandoravirus TaxID=2060084 RepID=A0AA95EEL4_9VIRU|nr:Glutamate dehydrogenase [Pandoravirus neocaledonia]AVK75999.1 Glutamate dehydrogenase [Pandoravirus neocaledonia]WBR14530.1 E/l/f/v dehydrogenase family protein [Pandoravirus kuranda]
MTTIVAHAAPATGAVDKSLPPGARPSAVPGQPPVAVYEWRDALTPAVGWIAIEDDPRLPPVGGGGLFVSPATTEAEVVDVARSMARKLRVTCAAGTVRGAKGGVRYDPSAPDVNDVVGRFMAAHAAVIRDAWATGADLNTDHAVLDALAQRHVGIPHCLHALAQRHPEARPEMLLHGSVVAVHPTEGDVASARSPRLAIAEAAVGYGVARALAALAHAKGNEKGGGSGAPLRGLDVAVQGFGTVGSTFALYARTLGARIVAIADRDHFVVRADGVDVHALVARRQQHAPTGSAQLADCFGDGAHNDEYVALTARGTDEDGDAWLARFLDACSGGVDVFAPCAQRYVMSPSTTEALAAAVARRRRHHHENGTQGVVPRAYVASGANNIARDPKAFKRFLDDNNVWTVPEWVSNAGTACLFMQAATLPPNMGSLDAALVHVGDRVAGFVARALALCQCEAGAATAPSALLDACHAVADDALCETALGVSASCPP